MTKASSVPRLPARLRTRSGVAFDPRQDVWSYRDGVRNVHLDFSALPASAALLASGRSVLCWYAENKSSHHLTNMFYRLADFLKQRLADTGTVLNEIDGAALLSYRASLTKRTEWYLSSFAGFIKKWSALGYPGVHVDAVKLLGALRLRGNRKGVAVLTMDPRHGPYTDMEREALIGSLDVAYERGEIGTDGYLLSRLFAALGQRPCQYASLKVCDLRRFRASDGTDTYILEMPRAKKRNALHRGALKSRVLIADLGRTLFDYSGGVRDAFRHLSQPSLAPLFPAQRLRVQPSDQFTGHRTADSISDLLQRTLNKLRICSERTGEPLHITPTRFRRTLGTNAAREGHGELIIAELLDHEDTQNVGMYTAATPEIVERIDRAVAMRMGRLAQAFAGKLIKNESEAVRGTDPSSRICDPRFDRDMRPLGNCGKYSFCSLLAPIACYTCSSFQPWIEAPHEEVLTFLIRERERVLKLADLRIASINDRAIAAVAQVIRQCEEARRG